MNDVIEIFELIDMRRVKRLQMQNYACYAMCIYVITKRMYSMKLMCANWK